MENQDFSNDERNAMRAYLQRMEVRMSTQHRIATAFIGGAGLLLLIPIFFRDVIDNVLAVVLSSLGSNAFPQWGLGGGISATIILYLALLYPFGLSLAIPLYGVYQLLKDLVHFYYTIYMPGYPESLLHPTFAQPTALFSPDESAKVKKAVQTYQYSHDHLHYLIPFSKERRELYFDTMLKETKGEIVPKSRQLDHLEAQGVLPLLTDEVRRDANHLNTALGLARGLDRPLVEEVALTELLVTRNVQYLRRLMMRYIKTLIMFLWTTGVMFLILPMLRDPRFPNFIVLGGGYLLWSLGVLPVMREPLHWIYRHRHEDHISRYIDPQLTHLERRLYWFCIASVPIALLGLIMAIFAYLQ